MNRMECIPYKAKIVEEIVSVMPRAYTLNASTNHVVTERVSIHESQLGKQPKTMLFI